MAERWADAISRGEIEVFDELVASDAIDHSGPSDVIGRDGFKARTQAIHAAFGDVRVVVDFLMAEGDRCAWRWTLTALHHGPFLGVAATGARVRMAGINIQRIAQGCVVEHWSNSDQLGLLLQVKGS